MIFDLAVVIPIQDENNIAILRYTKSKEYCKIQNKSITLKHAAIRYSNISSIDRKHHSAVFFFFSAEQLLPRKVNLEEDRRKGCYKPWQLCERLPWGKDRPSL